MASPTSPVPNTATPLADYFFICGIETSQIFDGRLSGHGFLKSPALGTTQEEDLSPVSVLDGSPSFVNGNEPSSKRQSKHLSSDVRKSIGSTNELDSRISTKSNRSSSNLRFSHTDEISINEAQQETEFEEILRRFAADRDSVIAQIQFSAGQVTQPNKPAPRPRPKTTRITGEADRSSIAIVKRRISTKNPPTRSNTTKRLSSSARNSRRMSGYNSVIPAPKRFSTDANMHPLKRPYEPVLLDQYPPRAEAKENKLRSPFPDYVPMFVFPNDINVVAADERPRTTWHGFAMTTSDNSRLYGVCTIVWIPLAHEVAAELEAQCEEWRNRNMSDAERDMAHSLGERLADQKSRLTELLAQLAHIPADSREREAKEEEINAVEERISVMTDILRPVRHGAAAKIEGLTDGDSGLWVPRAYGVLGKDSSLTSFWKEWLRAITVPMMNHSVVRVPLSSPRVGIFEPLERYVVNLCAEAFMPMNSITQVELAIRELRLYARKEAANEIPGSRGIDLYPLFRSLDIQDIIILFEYVLSESRIILLSSHTSMLHLVSKSILQLLYPLVWSSIFIPVLPARLIQALEAPCPYIVGIERRYDNVELPEDDFVLVDLDQGLIEATFAPTHAPRQQRRKLQSILNLAAPHHYRFGVPLGPPRYAQEAFPFDSFSSESPTLFDSRPPHSNLAQLSNLTSTSFGEKCSVSSKRLPILNAFLFARQTSNNELERPLTASTTKYLPPSPPRSPFSSSSPHSPFGPASRLEPGNAIQTTLREKRSGVFESSKRRNSSFGVDRINTLRRPSLPFAGHNSQTSVSTVGSDMSGQSRYAPSVYAQSTLAASTIMPSAMSQPIKNTGTTQWVEGHCMRWDGKKSKMVCSICNDNIDDGTYMCSGCGISSHSRCAEQICQVCPSAFYADQVSASFVRFFASLFYTYRKFMMPTPPDQKKSGMYYRFDWDGFLRSVPADQSEYLAMLRETQMFNEFIHDREFGKSDKPDIMLFDEIILSKRNRGRAGIFTKSSVSFLSDTSNHLWQTASATALSVKSPGPVGAGAMGRTPAKLDKALMREPRVVQGAPRLKPNLETAKRKPVPSKLRSNSKSKIDTNI